MPCHACIHLYVNHSWQWMASLGFAVAVPQSIRPSVCPAIATLHKILCHGLSRKSSLPAWTPSGAGRHVGRDNFVALTSQALARNVVGFARSWRGKRIVEILFYAFNTLWRSTPRHVITTALEVHGRSLCAFGRDILILILFLFLEVVCDYALCRVAHACEFSCVPQAWLSSVTFSFLLCWLSVENQLSTQKECSFFPVRALHTSGNYVIRERYLEVHALCRLLGS